MAEWLKFGPLVLHNQQRQMHGVGLRDHKLLGKNLRLALENSDFVFLNDESNHPHIIVPETKKKIYTCLRVHSILEVGGRQKREC